MKDIVISDAVWDAIARNGKFGETEDDVLRRILKIAPRGEESGSAATPRQVRKESATHRSGMRQSFATNKLSSNIHGNELRLQFASGPAESWKLPPKGEKAALRVVRDKATAFAERNGATLGQVNAVKKTLTDMGYHLLK